MKKVSVKLLALMCCCLMFGCGKHDGSQKKAIAKIDHSDSMMLMVSQARDLTAAQAIINDNVGNDCLKPIERYGDIQVPEGNNTFSYAVVIVKFPQCVARNICLAESAVAQRWDARAVADSFVNGSPLRVYAGCVSDDKTTLCLIGDWSDIKTFASQIYATVFRLQSNWMLPGEKKSVVSGLETRK